MSTRRAVWRGRGEGTDQKKNNTHTKALRLQEKRPIRKTGNSGKQTTEVG